MDTLVRPANSSERRVHTGEQGPEQQQPYVPRFRLFGKQWYLVPEPADSGEQNGSDLPNAELAACSHDRPCVRCLYYHRSHRHALDRPEENRITHGEERGCARLMAYINYTFATKKLKMPEPKINLYPLVCLHVGSPQADMKFIREHLKRITEDPHARWVYMGDGGECVTKLSKGDVYGQILSPYQQMEMLDDLLRPIAAKGLFGIRGNHGNRIYKESGL